MQPKFEVQHTVGGAYNLNYHLVWTTAFNRKVLDDEIAEYIKEVALEAAGKIGVQVHLFEIVDDHYVNCLLSAPPKISVTDILKILKGKTAMYAVKKYPELKTRSKIVISDARRGMPGQVSGHKKKAPVLRFQMS